MLVLGENEDQVLTFRASGLISTEDPGTLCVSLPCTDEPVPWVLGDLHL